MTNKANPYPKCNTLSLPAGLATCCSELTGRRRMLKLMGFEPIPVNGKVPKMRGWPDPHSLEEIASWEKTRPKETNTGVTTKFTPALDVDILDSNAARAVEKLARQRFADRGVILVRIGLAPKRAVLFRTDEPFAKITANVTAPDGSTGQKLEFLGDGQQVVCFGIHPDTKGRYSWHGGAPGHDEPGLVERSELPAITAEEAKVFVADAAQLLKQYGYRAAETTAKGDDGGERVDWSEQVANIIQGQNLHDSIRDLGSSLIGTGVSPGAVKGLLRAITNNSTAPHDARWRERFDDIGRAVESAKKKFDAGTAPPLTYTDVRGPLLPRQWVVRDRVPANNVTLASGEGGAGKSMIFMQLTACVVLERKWFGMVPAQGKALYISCEDDEDEMRRRFEDIAQHYGSSRDELMQRGLHVICRVCEDTSLATPDKNGQIRPTALFEELCEEAASLRPKLIVLDTASDVFGGNEINRAQVTQFLTMLRLLAREAGGAGVVLIAHPSLTGISSGSGLSGSTGWHNRVRARAYVKLPRPEKPEEGEEPPPPSNERELSFMKNNYGPQGETLTVQYREGVFVVDAPPGETDVRAAQRSAEKVFRALLKRYTEAGRSVSDKASKAYAPAQFAGEAEAKKAKLSKRDLEAAMKRLFAREIIKVVTEGPASRQRSRIVEAD